MTSDLRKLLTENGYTLSALTVPGDCYVMTGITEEGEQVYLILDIKTADVMWYEVRENPPAQQEGRQVNTP